MTPEERAEKIRQMFNKAKDASGRAKKKADGYFQIIKDSVDKGLDKIESKTSKYNGDNQWSGGIMAPPPKKPFPAVETQGTKPAAKKSRPKRFEL